MKRLLLLIFCCVSTVAFAQTKIEGLKFAEGTVPYKNMILVSNFGTDSLNPLNTEGRGYIVAIDGDGQHILIPPKGYLSAPKGMAIVDHHLFVADVGSVVVFNLKKPNEKPRVLKLGANDLFANDIAVMGDIVLVSVTNTGCIYGIDASDIKNLGAPKMMGTIPGANGMVVSAGRLYVASYDPGEKPSSDNVIYVCDIASGAKSIEPLIKDLPGGQYDGIAVSEDGETLYFTSWSGKEGGAVYSYKLSGEEPVRTLDFGVKLVGPADISIADGVIYIPDLPKSILYRFTL